MKFHLYVKDKGKRDAKCCGSYNSMKLLEHGMKVMEKNFEKRLSKQVKIDETQIGAMVGKCNIFGMTDDGEAGDGKATTLYGICRLGKSI